MKFISWNKNQNLFEANYDRRWWWASWMGLVKEKIISFYNNWSKVRRNPRRSAIVSCGFRHTFLFHPCCASIRKITKYITYKVSIHVKTNKIQKFLVNKQKTEEENAKMLSIKELMDNWNGWINLDCMKASDNANKLLKKLLL